jgi:prepilin-type N-terminal cleavage/methylation domain-containing protein
VQSRHPGDTPYVPAPGGSGSVRAGFTLIELMIVIGIIVVLVGILVPVVGRARASGQSVACLGNLRQIGVAFHAYADANKGMLPDPAATQESWESMLRDHLPNREIFHCMSDGGLFDKLRSSYDWRDTGNPRTTIAGRSLLGIRRPGAVMAFDALPDWHAPGQINTLRAGGSVESMPHQECLQDLDRPIDQR